MKKIYIKNYKGFDEEIIELGDVNFFVGENSTGKTSILQLITVLSSTEFWFDTEFSNKEVEMGYFDEILNHNSEAKTFLIGFEIPINKNESKKKRILLEFYEEDNIPKLIKVKTSVEKKDFLMKFTKKEVVF